VDSSSRAALLFDSPSATFAASAVSWYYFGAMRELVRGPVAFDLPGGHRYVGFLGHDRTPVVLSARCAHMGADLANGCVREGRLVCPLHGWEYNADGHCVHIPAAAGGTPPAFARQTRFPTVERGGQVFFFNEPRARFPAPFFDGVAPAELRAARAFDLHDSVPWYFVGANAFDLQHFRNAHDRELVSEPVVDASDPFARRITLRLRVAGHSLGDRITRCFAGRELTMTITVWGGTLIFVCARFRRATSFGLMTVRPLEHNATHARVIVWVRRSRHLPGRILFDVASLEVRRFFIRQFLRADLGRMSGARYFPGRLIEADKPFAEYMEWLRLTHR
jgi:phenylpropionate dioxygenase-like ring-hydroxylating dioxygenase large terminal subunit